MKVFVLVALCVALAQAKRLTIDDIKSRDVEPEFLLKLKKTGSRIVGGSEATPNSFPHQVGLILEHSSGDGYFCGGSILNEEWIVTAAHCADGIVQVEVILGAHEITNTEEATQQRIISNELVVHPNWDSSTLSNDIALIRLPEPANLASAAITPIEQLSSQEIGNSFDGAASTISGWGKDSDDSETISPVLRYIDVPVISNSACNLYYFGMITDDHICADQSTCSGDSGGPLISNVGGVDKQVGVVSFGISFGCEVGWPAVFTRMGNYLSWVNQVTGV